MPAEAPTPEAIAASNDAFENAVLLTVRKGEGMRIIGDGFTFVTFDTIDDVTAGVFHDEAVPRFFLDVLPEINEGDGVQFLHRLSLDYRYLDPNTHRVRRSDYPYTMPKSLKEVHDSEARLLGVVTESKIKPAKRYLDRRHQEEAEEKIEVTPPLEKPLQTYGMDDPDLEADAIEGIEKLYKIIEEAEESSEFANWVDDEGLTYVHPDDVLKYAKALTLMASLVEDDHHRGVAILRDLLSI